MKRMSLVAVALALVLGATTSAADDKEMTLTGCVVKGDGGYVLTNATLVGAPDAVLITPRTLFWLDEDDLEDHAGQRVEVKGKVEKDIDRGEIEIEREDGMIEIEFKAEGDKITLKLPDTYAAHQAVGTTGVEVTDKPKELEFLVRKFDVKSIKTLSSACM